MLDQLFLVAIVLEAVAILALLFSPLVPRLADTVAGYLIPAVLAAIAIAVFAADPTAFAGTYTSLEAMAKALSAPTAAFVLLMHILAVDLFFAAWMVRVARREGISFWFIAPAVVAIGVVGSPLIVLVLFAARTIRQWRGRRVPSGT